MKTERIIDLGNLGTMVSKVEKVFEEADLNLLDRSLVLKEVDARIQTALQKQRAQDLVESISVGGIMGKVMSRLTKGKEAEDEA